MMAMKLNVILGSYIHKDQVGFMKGRYLTDNVKKVLTGYVQKNYSLCNLYFKGKESI